MFGDREHTAQGRAKHVLGSCLGLVWSSGGLSPRPDYHASRCSGKDPPKRAAEIEPKLTLGLADLRKRALYMVAMTTNRITSLRVL